MHREAPLIVLLLLFGVSVGAAQDVPRDAPAIVPLPQAVVWGEGTLLPHSLTSIVLGRGTSSGDRQAAEWLQQTLRENGIEVTIDYEGPETRPTGAIGLRVVPGGDEDGYRLAIDSTGARIEGASERGRFYGAMSLLQLLRARDHRAMHIVDYPGHPLRGFVDDVHPQFPTRAEFERLLRFLGEHKLNLYGLPVDGIVPLPAAAQDSGLVSIDDLEALQDLAASYHVEIVPVVRIPDPVERRRREPDEAGPAEYPGAAAVGVEDSTTYERVADMLDIVLPLFRSRYVHIGGERSRTVGLATSAGARARPRQYLEVAELVRSRGKTVLVRAEALPSLDDVPEGFVLLGEATASLPPGTEVVAAPALLERDRVYPNHAAARDRIASASKQPGAAGILAHVAYGEAPVLRGMIDREMAYVAEYGWNPGVDGGTDARFDRIRYGQERDNDLEMALARFTAGVRIPGVWDHPMHRQRPASDLPPGHVREATERILTEVEQLQRDARRHGDAFDYYAFALRFAAWHAETAELGTWMKRAVIPGEGSLEYGAAWAEGLAGEARSLAQAYRSLWLRTNREVYLARVLGRFTYQVAYLERMAAALGDGRVDVVSETPSRFIGSGAETAHLRTTFALERGQVEMAYLQVVGRSDIDVWVNGDRVGRAVGAEWTDVHVWNVAPRLRSGDNVIAVRASHRGDSAAAANVFLEIHFLDGRVHQVASDASWRASATADDRWQRDRFPIDSWSPARLVDAAPILAVPMFERGLPSAVEER